MGGRTGRGWGKAEICPNPPKRVSFGVDVKRFVHREAFLLRRGVWGTR